MPHRTFMAVDLEPIIRDRLVGCQQEVIGADRVNLVSPANLHITMNFLGDVADEVLPEVLDMMQAVAGEVEPFDVDVLGAEVVPPGGAVRMLWAGVSDPTRQLYRLYNLLGEALSGLGLRQEDRRYKPHVTLARVKYLADPRAFRLRAQRLAREDFGVQHVDHLVAYTSVLSSDGPTYTPLARADLGV